MSSPGWASKRSPASKLRRRADAGSASARAPPGGWSCPASTEALVRDADAVLLLTPHSTYDLDELMAWSKMLFDARNATGRRDKRNVVVL